MKLVKDLVPTDGDKLYRYAVCNAAGEETGEYMYLKYAPGELAQTPTPVNAALFEDVYGYSNEVITKNADGSITKTSNGITETTVKNADGSITTTKTDGTKTITRTITINADGTISKTTGGVSQ